MQCLIHGVFRQGLGGQSSVGTAAEGEGGQEEDGTSEGEGGDGQEQAGGAAAVWGSSSTCRWSGSCRGWMTVITGATPAVGVAACWGRHRAGCLDC